MNKTEKANLVEAGKGLLAYIVLFGGLILLALWVRGVDAAELTTQIPTCSGTADTDLFRAEPEKYMGIVLGVGGKVTMDKVEGNVRYTRMWFRRSGRDGNGNSFLKSVKDDNGTYRVVYMALSLGSQSEGGGKYDFMETVRDARENSPGCEGGYANEWAYIQRFDDETAAAVVLWSVKDEGTGNYGYVVSYMVGLEVEVMNFIHKEGLGKTST